MKPVPIVDQYPKRETVAPAPCALGCRGLFALGRRIAALRHVTHNGRRRFAGLRERDCRTGAKRHAPFVAVQRVLAEIGSTAASGHAHGQAALRIIEDEPVLAAALGRELLDFPLGKLHDFPALLRVRTGSADP